VAARALTAHVASPSARATAAVVVTAAALLVLAALVVWPLAAVFVYGVSDLARVGLAPLGALGGTLKLAATSTTITVLLGLAVAYASTRTTMFGAALTARLLLLALVLPPFLPALALRVVTAGMAPAVGFPALVLSQVLAFLPLAFLILGNALAAANGDEEDAAESLGAGRLTIFTRITLAQLRRALATATTGIFLLCAADLANPLVIGGGHAVLSVQAYVNAVSGDRGAGVAIALWLLAPCLVAAALGGWRAGAVFTVPAARRRPQRPTPATVALPLTVVTAVVTLVLAAVWTIVVVEALVPVRSADWTPLGASVVLAATVSVMGTVLVLAVAGLVGRRGGGAGAVLLERLALLPAAVPGLVLGLGYLLAYARPPITPLWVVVAAVIAARLPAATAAAVASVRQVDTDAAAAAVGLGAGRRRVFSRVVAPVLAPAAASLLVYFFVRALVAVSVVAVLAGSRDQVASVAAIADAAAGRVGDACLQVASLSVVVVVVVAFRRALPERSATAVWFF
jgi:iron(III) transport system permease protein